MPKQINDLIGQRFGRLTVLRLSDKTDKYGEIFWQCLCDCGKETVVRGHSLRRKTGSTKSCGCLQREIERQIGYRNASDLTGHSFGRLTANMKSEKRSSDGHIMWECTCMCGKSVLVKSCSLVSGKTKSCGCLARESSINNLPKDQHKETHPSWKGGVTPWRKQIYSSPEYKAWRQSVFKRDKYTCTKCDHIGGKLRAHHLFNFSDFIMLRTETCNGITLCKHCHEEFHVIFGKYNNTASQLIDYILFY
jgi:hypothetical protein